MSLTSTNHIPPYTFLILNFFTLQISLSLIREFQNKTYNLKKDFRSILVVQYYFPTSVSIVFICIISTIHADYCPVTWGSKKHRLHLCRGLRKLHLPTGVLDMILNNPMVRFQWCWRFGKSGASLHYHYSQVHSAPKWLHLTGPYLWVKQN